MIPLISICIPTYNGAAFIAEAMDSAIAQTYKNLEIIVSDDASRDNTLKIVESYKSKTDVPIHIFHHKPSGIGANWNNSIKNAQGKFIKFLFQDDVLEPSCISEMAEVLENNLNTFLVSSKRHFIIENDVGPKEAERWIRQFSDLQQGLTLKTDNGVKQIDKTLFKDSNFLKNPLNKVGEPSAYMFRKEVLDEVGEFRTDLKQILDMEFCFRILKNHKIAVISKELVGFRLHKNQASNMNKGDNTDLIVLRKILMVHYFWYLSWRHKWSILKTQSLILKTFIKLKRKISKL